MSPDEWVMSPTVMNNYVIKNAAVSVSAMAVGISMVTTDLAATPC